MCRVAVVRLSCGCRAAANEHSWYSCLLVWAVTPGEAVSVQNCARMPFRSMLVTTAVIKVLYSW